MTIACIGKYRERARAKNMVIKIEVEDIGPKQFKDNSNKTDITKNDKLITQISKFSSKMEDDHDSVDVTKEK